MSRDVIWSLGAWALFGLILAVLTLLVFVLVNRSRRAYVARYDQTKAAAASYGLHPPGQVALDALPWLPLLPDQGAGQFTMMFVGQRGGRPVLVAEYLRSKPTYRNAGGTERGIVVTVRMPAPLPAQSGPCRFGSWFTAGADVAIYLKGQLGFPTVLGVVDELLAVAARLGN